MAKIASESIANRCIAALAATLCFALPQQAAAEDDPPLEYRVKKGDTLIGLADRYLVRPSAYRIVQRQNGVRNARRLRIGQKLLLPRAILKTRPASLVIESFSGPVQASRSGGAIGLAVGTDIPEGTELRTGRSGFLTLRGLKNSTVSIPSQSHVQITRIRRLVINDALDVELRVISGRGKFAPPNLQKDGRYRVRTPVAVSAVRGTTFRIAFDEAMGSASEVIEGTVAVAGTDGESAVSEGFGIIARETGLLPQEKLLPPPGLANPGKIQTDEAIQFNLEPVAGARAYRSQISRDAGALEVVAEAVTDAPSVAFESTPNGNYFLHSRAIAESGLEGLPETNSFRRQRLGVTAAAEPAGLENGFKFSWQQQGEGTALFEFQLWPEGRQAEMVVDEIGLGVNTMTLTNLPPGPYVWRVGAVQASEDGILRVWGPEQKLNIN